MTINVFFMKAGMKKNDIAIIVREDHQTEWCRGSAADPRTAPAIANISINKTSGEIGSPDAAEGFAEE